MVQYKGALDLSGKSALMAITNFNGDVLLDLSRPMNGRESAQLATWIIAELDKINLKISDINFWTIGSGPGSFTGMRLVAALVTGWSSLSDVKTRCVPTALAIANSGVTPSQNERIAVLFDGRNSELLAFEVVSNDTELKVGSFSGVWSKEEAIKNIEQGLFDKFVIQKDDLNAFERLLGESFTTKVQIVDKPSLVSLIENNEFEYNNDLTQLVYIRPAVYS